MRMMCLGLLLVAQVASAQSLPDAKALLEREATAFDAFSSYRFEEVTTVTMTVSGMPIDVQMTTAVTAVNPGKRRMATKMAGMDMQLLVANGTDVWMLVPMLNQYMHLSGNDSPPAFGGGFLTTLGTSDAAKVVRSESVTIDGTSHDCWVVESRSDRIGVSGMEMRDVNATSWIDQSTGVTWRRTMKAMMPEGLLPVGGEVRMESVRRGLVVNEPVSDSVFVFTPPPGATEMSLDGIAGLPGLAPGAPAALPPAVTPRRKSAAPVLPGERLVETTCDHGIECRPRGGDRGRGRVEREQIVHRNVAHLALTAPGAERGEQRLRDQTIGVVRLEQAFDQVQVCRAQEVRGRRRR